MIPLGSARESETASWAAESRAARYGLTQSVADYTRYANQVAVTAVPGETQQGIETLESIIAVPGVDYSGHANKLADLWRIQVALHLSRSFCCSRYWHGLYRSGSPLARRESAVRDSF